MDSTIRGAEHSLPVALLAAASVPPSAAVAAHQSQFLVLYDWRRTRVRAFCRAASDAALGLLALHAPALSADVGGGLWGTFTCGGAHVGAAQQLVANLRGGSREGSRQGGWGCCRTSCFPGVGQQAR